MTVPTEEAPANFVPAAAVIRRGLALFGFTGRKAHVGIGQLGVKSWSSTPELPLILPVSSPEEVSGTPSVEVEFVDIRKNTSGEGGLLVRY